MHRATGNRFLDALPPDVTEAVARIANLRVYAEGARLNASGDPLREVCFPIAGAIAHVEHDAEGRAAEILTIGAEGVSNFEALLGAERSLYARLTNVPVSAFVLDVRQIESLQRQPEIAQLAKRYALAMVRVAGLSAACHRHDQVDARLAAWLLRLHDYAGSREFALTHDRTAAMLGARRASVTAAYNRLVADGALRASRRYVEIVDVGALASAACGCLREAQSIVEALYEPHGNGNGGSVPAEGRSR